MIRIRCPDGILRAYADYEDVVKPVWKEKMRKEDKIRWLRNGLKTKKVG